MAACVCAGIIFVGGGYLYLNRELSTVENKTYSVPYYSPAPENAGVMFRIGQQGVLVYLDFEDNNIRFVYDTKDTPTGGLLYGYTVDYTVESDFDLLSGIVDILGGIELERDGEILRYTGVQVSELLLKNNCDRDLCDEVILKITEKVKNTGFQNEDFLYIIENSSTDLSLPDCYYWREYISALCGNVQIVN